MFGLMRAKKCGMSGEEKLFRRLNYCGTCKTTGALYGQKARFLLNHDAVFLAELLSAIKGENVADWNAAYQSYNCLSLPRGAMPFALAYAATVNVILTEFKLDDHAADEGKRRYRLAQNAFASEFQKARELLAEWNFPLAEVEEILSSQTRREREAKSLEEFAFPTAQATAVFFREGVRKIGESELAATAFGLGFAFGKLIYLVDAFEDYEKDFKTAKFNAFRAAFDLREEKLTAAARRRAADVLRAIEREITEKINLLPLKENQKSLFVSRLSDNLERKLQTNLPVLKTPPHACAAKPRLTFSQRWKNAADRARELARQYRWQAPLAFLFVFAFTLAAPAASREARSARECFDLSFNLITLGAIFGAVLSLTPLKMVAVNHKRKKKQAAEGGEESSGWCDWCDCDCCCCDSCDGDCCDGCDCCSGCCDNCGCDGCCDCSCDC